MRSFASSINITGSLLVISHNRACNFINEITPVMLVCERKPNQRRGCAAVSPRTPTTPTARSNRRPGATHERVSGARKPRPPAAAHCRTLAPPGGAIRPAHGSRFIVRRTSRRRAWVYRQPLARVDESMEAADVVARRTARGSSVTIGRIDIGVVN